MGFGASFSDIRAETAGWQRAAQQVLQNLRPEFVHAADQGPLRAGRLDVSNER